MLAQHKNNIGAASFLCVIVGLFLFNTEDTGSRNVLTVSTTLCFNVEKASQNVDQHKPSVEPSFLLCVQS